MTQHSPGTAARSDAPTVLVADDSPTLRRIVSSVLQQDGFTVVAVRDGVEAVQQAFLRQPDAIVLDVQMPRLSGYVAARLLKDDWQTADIPVVMLTSLDAASDRYWGGHVGADRYLTKDFEGDELTEAVRELLAEAADRRGGRPAHQPDPLDLDDDEVLARVCELLDRKLFEASVVSEVTALAAEVRGLESTLAALLGVLARVVDHDLAALTLFEDRVSWVSVAGEATRRQLEDLQGAVVSAASSSLGADAALQTRLLDPARLVDGDDPMATVLSMPLRVRGAGIGLLTLSSATVNAFGESALRTLRLVEAAAALVVDGALHARSTAATAAGREGRSAPDEPVVPAA